MKRVLLQRGNGRLFAIGRGVGGEKSARQQQSWLRCRLRRGPFECVGAIDPRWKQEKMSEKNWQLNEMASARAGDVDIELQPKEPAS